jgi:large subunit ribosomal protein L35
MPKQKTHKASKKRFRVTASGKVMHRGTGTSHLGSHLTQKRVRKLRGTRALCPADAKRIKNALRGNSY